jgi:hypothetical protein
MTNETRLEIDMTVETNTTETLPETTETPSAEIARPALGGIDEARRYRKRAQAAEKKLEELQSDLAAREQTIADQQQQLVSIERRQKVDDLLRRERVLDLEAARMLTQVALDSMEQPDIEQAVIELRTSKPYLFSSRQLRSATALSPKVQSEMSPRAQALEQAATEAQSTGKRSDLLRYLRLRRK